VYREQDDIEMSVGSIGDYPLVMFRQCLQKYGGLIRIEPLYYLTAHCYRHEKRKDFYKLIRGLLWYL